jgi:cell division protein FtsQ
MRDAVALPLDVRAMHLCAHALLLLAAVLVLAEAVGWVWGHPRFALRGVTVVGDVAHTNAVTARANVLPRLQGSFFSIDLQRTRTAFESLPWVRRAVVHREFPGRLRVQLEEHRAVAYWGAEGEPRLVNSYGEVFEANAGELDSDALPRLTGPSDQAATVLAMLKTIEPVLAPLSWRVEQLQLSAHGSWRVELDSGASIELGSGDSTAVLARLGRLRSTVTAVSARYGRTPQALESADLRHEDGYAIRLRGVSTGSDARAQS